MNHKLKILIIIDSPDLREKVFSVLNDQAMNSISPVKAFLKYLPNLGQLHVGSQVMVIELTDQKNLTHFSEEFSTILKIMNNLDKIISIGAGLNPEALKDTGKIKVVEILPNLIEASLRKEVIN